MGDPGALGRYLHWLLFIGLALLVLFIEALPFNLGATSWPGPQAMALLAMAWVLRRPDYMPVVIFAVLALIADLFQMRPPGLMAGLLVLVLEFLRSRHHAAREWPFVLEWAVVSALLSMVLVANRLILGILAVPQPALGIEVQQLISSILFYPIILAFSVWALRITHIKPGEGGIRL